ncbi:hypothetical protein GOP47_0008485 [Adiantum capillus-veneris]|uniref:Uncharacterized protein n=1 Tax=Adiantum capillus-veneris TaxID=13818 RepID=A0A9D4ZKR8_ADICA|nr:hypothetical protein GOP47_0008485 [Adiantum capillus-veneris]
MASSLLSARPHLSSSFCCPTSQLCISSSGSTFVSIAHFKQESPLSSLQSKAESAGFLPVECSSRPQKKCTAHHNKTRPKKHNPSDKNRKPAVYPPFPDPPPAVVLGWGDEDDDDDDASPASAPAPSAAEPAVVGA